MVESLLIFFGFIAVLVYFANRPPGVFHWAMVGWFVSALLIFILQVEGVVPEADGSFTGFASFYILGGGVIPFIYFVGRGAILFFDDISRGVQKVNRHLDSPTTHHGQQYLYDENTGQWYVYTAHVEQWTPTSAPR